MLRALAEDIGDPLVRGVDSAESGSYAVVQAHDVVYAETMTNLRRLGGGKDAEERRQAFVEEVFASLHRIRVSREDLPLVGLDFSNAPKAIAQVRTWIAQIVSKEFERRAQVQREVDAMDRAQAVREVVEPEDDEKGKDAKKKNNGVMSAVVTRRTSDGIMATATDLSGKKYACYIPVNAHSGIPYRPGDEIKVRRTSDAKKGGQRCYDAELVD